MHYLGGKSRIGHLIAAQLSSVRGALPFWDPFCGGLSVAVALSKQGRGLVSDANTALIALYKAVAAGWDPPENVTEAEYHTAKTLPDSDPLKAFIGIGCSFGGKWFGGFARETGRRLKPGKLSYAQTARNALLRDVPTLIARGCVFANLDFFEIDPHPGVVLYLDPPYRGTTGYMQKFDHARFYVRLQQWARVADVFVSEYDLPLGSLVWQREVCTTAGLAKGKSGSRSERLYHLGPSALDHIL